MKDNDKFDAIRLMRNGNVRQDNASEEISNEEFRNINLQKILGDNIEPDEKVVCVARSHWSLLASAMFLLFMSIGAMLTKGNHEVFIILASTFALIGLFLWTNTKVILTNKRYLISFGSKRKGLLLQNIVRIKSYTNFLGCGKLFIERPEYPSKLIPSIGHLKNVEELELKANELIELTRSQVQPVNNLDKRQAINESNKLELPFVIICFTIIQIFLIYKNIVILSKVLALIFVIYLIFNNLFRKIQ